MLCQLSTSVLIINERFQLMKILPKIKKQLLSPTHTTL